MVLLGGLELVAAGYIIHKHQQNKRDKQRLNDEAAALEEQQYRIFPTDGRHSRHDERPERRRRSHSRTDSRRRRSDERYGRPHSEDGKYRRRPSPSPQPKPLKPILKKPSNLSNPQLSQQRPPPYPAVVAGAVPPAAQHLAPQAQYQAPPPQAYPQDVKYGWTDGQQQQQRPQYDPNAPPTGWPVEWQQSQGAESSSRGTQQQRQMGESSRGRTGGRHSPSVRSLSQSPPPSYRV